MKTTEIIRERKNIIVISNSMANNISERGLSKNYSVKIKIFTRVTTKK